MKKRIIILSILLFGLYGIGIISTNTFKVQTDNSTYFDDNSEEVGKMYVETYSGSIKNKYTEDNPLIITSNETITFHMAIPEEEYSQLKNELESVVYNTNNDNDSFALSQTMNDTFYDEFHGIRFAYKGVANGNCRVVIQNKNTKEIYETVYVNSVTPNVLRFHNPLTNKIDHNPGTVTIDTGAMLKLSAIITYDLRMNGDVPSEENFYGSGFWSWDVPVTNNWTRLENNKWLVEYSIQTQGEGQFNVGLGINGNGQFNSLTVKVIHNKIEIDEINIGTLTYNNINKHIATKMKNGINNGDNSQYNRYVVLIGEDIKVNAPVAEDYTFELSNNNTLTPTTDTEVNENKISRTFKAMNPGDNEIVLKNGTGNVVETFYVQARYPIYVETNNGEIEKDCIHEYLDAAIHDFYNAHPEAIISDPEGTPQYVKNGRDYYMFYYLFGDNSVKVSTYLRQEDDRDFEIEGNLEMKNHEVTNIDSGAKAGFKKISAEFRVTVPESGGMVKVGYDNFVIAQKSDNESIHHIDIETTDGGNFTKYEAINYSDGYTKVEETVYLTKITSIHGSKTFDQNGNIIIEIPQNEYWSHYNYPNTQFESTSAYITNEQGQLIDYNGRVIDDLVRAGLVNPPLKDRQIELKNISKVDFEVDLRLIPIKKTTSIYKKTDGDEKELVSTEEIDASTLEEEKMDNYTLSMNQTQIIDAYNKCPYHSGLDFTIKVKLSKETYTNKTIDGIINPVTRNNIAIIISIMLLIGLYGVYSYKKKNNNIN